MMHLLLVASQRGESSILGHEQQQGVHVVVLAFQSRLDGLFQRLLVRVELRMAQEYSVVGLLHSHAIAPTQTAQYSDRQV